MSVTAMDCEEIVIVNPVAVVMERLQMRSRSRGRPDKETAVKRLMKRSSSLWKFKFPLCNLPKQLDFLWVIWVTILSQPVLCHKLR